MPLLAAGSRSGHGREDETFRRVGLTTLPEQSQYVLIGLRRQ